MRQTFAMSAGGLGDGRCAVVDARDHRGGLGEPQTRAIRHRDKGGSGDGGWVGVGRG